MKKLEMIRKLEVMRNSLINSYGFIDLTFLNSEDGFKVKLNEQEMKLITEYIDKQFQIYRNSWLIPVIDYMLKELKK